MLQRLPTVCGALVFQWLGLQELLATRSCASALRERYTPHHHIWRTLRPDDKRLRLQLCASVASAALTHAAYAITVVNIQQ
jgi:hypothetical protein